MRQEFIDTDASSLLEKTKEMKDSGHRLEQICATTVGQDVQVLYSFDKDFDLTCLRVTVRGDTPLESITEYYWPAFIYENEIHDLFGIGFLNSRLDYKGNFFRLSRKTPWKSDITKGAE